MEFKEIAQQLKDKFSPAIITIDEGSQFVRAAPASIRNVAEYCKAEPELDFSALSCLSGVDYRDRIELVYHLISYRKKHGLVIKVYLDRGHPVVDSVEGIWKTANWHERECFDLLGISFPGHPDLRRLLLPDDWPGHPLRKDYVPPAEYHGMSHNRPNPLVRPQPQQEAGS